jgi:hypothetical protein
LALEVGERGLGVRDGKDAINEQVLEGQGRGRENAEAGEGAEHQMFFLHHFPLS